MSIVATSESNSNVTGARPEEFDTLTVKDGTSAQAIPFESLRDRHDGESELPTPSTAVEELERWNKPRSNMWRVFATFISFLILGMNDATPGALIPYLEEYYGLSYTTVSLVFLPQSVGYSCAALLNNTVHRFSGQRGIAIITSSCHVITYLIFSLHPPYPVLVVFLALAGFGNGFADAAWCAWTGNMKSANKVQGFLQSFYSLGATISPLIATTMITQAGLPWYAWYYVMTSISFIELLCTTWAFWHKTGLRYREDNPKTEAGGGGTREAVKQRVTWICAFYFLTYIGLEVALGGWIVTFMLRVRNATPYISGISATVFWLGQCVGRAVLGFVTERFGERICVFVYLGLCIGFELIFWLVPNIVASAVAVSFLGLFLGPLFPAGVVMCAKLLPKRLHVSALGFATAIGGVGGAVLPFAVGAIAEVKGVQVLQPIALALLVVISGLWISLPRIKKTRTN